jgi:hypothetical protein
MTVPLSYQFSDEEQQATGMFGGPRGRIRPRGAYTVTGVGDPNMGYNGLGYNWNTYPGLLGGQSGYQDVSTETGMPVDNTHTADSVKVGGGVTTASQDDNIPNQGMSEGGTAAY